MRFFLPVLPGNIHTFSSFNAKPLHIAILKLPGQRRKQLHLSAPVLHQHVGNGSRAAEIPVNLERRMGVPEIGIGGSGEQGAQVGIGIFESSKMANTLVIQAQLQPVCRLRFPAGASGISCRPPSAFHFLQTALKGTIHINGKYGGDRVPVLHTPHAIPEAVQSSLSERGPGGAAFP